MKEETIRVWFSSRDKSFGEVLARALGAGYEICQDSARDIDAILLDASSAGPDECDDILRSMRTPLKSSPVPPPIIAMVHEDEQETVHALTEDGVYETLASPPDIRELRLVLRRAHRYHQIEVDLAQSRSRQQTLGQLGDLIGRSEGIQQVFEMARKVAACDVSVLILGETGTGKELLARAIHRLSLRADGPFVPFSCANLPEPLIDDELFGHEKGAFTGAVGLRRGRFEVADQGTVFLDEIGDLAPGLQAKLLRVLQERSFERLGSNTPLNTDVRVVCATHHDLEEMAQDGRFRMDLYFRLNVVQLRIPPLRERREDIPLLIQQFLRNYAKQFGKPAKRVSEAAMRALEEYFWPGNVRELENVVQRAVVLSDGKTVELSHLPEKIHNGIVQPLVASQYEEAVQEFKRRLVLRALHDCKGNRTEAARLLGITRGFLHRLLNQLNVHASNAVVPAAKCGEIDELPPTPEQQ